MNTGTVDKNKLIKLTNMKINFKFDVNKRRPLCRSYDIRYKVESH